MNTPDKKPYIFISYAHADGDKVLPAINALQKSGVNLWYDNGIAAGSEWPEFIAEKVVGCNSFVLFISNAYLESQNCKRELNFAIARKKDILSIFLEDVNLSPGMEMQLGSYQAIYRKRFTTESAFHSSLAAEPFFNTCRVGAESVETPENKRIPEFSSEISSKPGTAAPLPAKNKNKLLAGLLSIFLGGLGINLFYLGNYIAGIASLVFCWTYIPSIINLIFGIRLLIMKEEVFKEKVAKKATIIEYFTK